MTDFLARIAARAVGAPPAARPRPAAIFEEPAPRAGEAGDVAERETRGRIVAESSRRQPRAQAATPEPITTERPAPAHEREAAPPRPDSVENSEPERVGRAEPAGAAEEREARPRRVVGPDEAVVTVPVRTRATSPHAEERDAADGIDQEAPAPAPAVVAARPVPAPRMIGAPSPAPARWDTPVSAAAEQGTVKVHIGRLEVRAEVRETPRPEPRPVPEPATLSLGDYLRGERESRQ